MDTRLPADVELLADAATRSLRRAGGVDLARRAEADPAMRAGVGSLLRGLGTGDLDVRADLEQLLAGAVICRAVGAVAAPWPVAGELLAVQGRYLVLVDPATVRVDHGSLDVAWVGASLSGQAWDLVVAPERVAGRLGPFVTGAGLGPASEAVGADDVARYLVLQSWTLLGAAESAVAEVVGHLRTREQFGQPLSQFQAVRFAMADASVGVRGLEQLAKFTAWRLCRGDAETGFADALALRLHAAEVTVATLRTAHQLYGALGFCDETDLSILDRHLQPILRYPHSAERIAQALVPAVSSGVLSPAIA